MEYIVKKKLYKALCGLQGMMDTLFILVIDFSRMHVAFLSWNIILLKNPEISHRNVDGVWLLLLNGISHFIAENFEEQNFVFGVE